MNAHSRDTAADLRTFPTGFGQSDTHAKILNDGRANPSPLAGTPYATITSTEIAALLSNPQSVPKEEARWFIPSTYAEHDARSSDVQRERGQYLFLPIDIDDNDLSLEDVVDALNAVVPGVSQIIYSSRSATASARRWRALVPLAAPLSGADYRDTQEALFEALEAATAGVLIPCRGFLTPAQPVYLPNAGEHYEHHSERGQRLDLTDHAITRLREQRRAERVGVAGEAQRRREQKARERAARASDGDVQPVNHFNDRHTVEQLLGKYGYKHGGGDDWRSPMQSSGSYATRSFDDYWISLSASDAAAEIGAPSKSGHRFGDAFDLFAHFEHRGKFTEAVRAYAQEAGLDGTQQQYAGGPDFDWRSKAQDKQGKAEGAERASTYWSGPDFATRPLPVRRWLVEDLVPDRTVTLLTGDGGTGKSLLALQLAVAVATDRPWIGRPVKSGTSLVFSAEDDTDELHLRLHAIAHAEGMRLEALEKITVRSLAGEDALLAVLQGRSGVLAATDFYHEIAAKIADARPAVVILDTSADLYGGDENNRVQVRQFIGLLRHLALAHECAVILLSHPSLTGLNSGTGTSGSTAWNNSVRSRLYLERQVVDGYEANADARILSTKKANYGRAGGEIELFWNEGVFLPKVVAPQSGLDGMAASAKAERIFLKLLGQFTEQGRRVNANGGPTYAPKAFADSGEAEGCTKRVLKAAMDKLFHAGKIRMATSGPASRQVTFIERVTE